MLADTYNRKKLILFTAAFNLLPGFGARAIDRNGVVQVWHINALNVVTSSLQVLGGPARQAIIPSLVPQSLSSKRGYFVDLDDAGNAANRAGVCRVPDRFLRLGCFLYRRCFVAGAGDLLCFAGTQFRTTTRRAATGKLAQPDRGF